mmetsp:Transcript_39689/g.104794  ORF Transcript_39689/g.104794 Transcript_39689/m.104794 type:complete len:456 (+) Transcript_39689:18-1385(+)
MRWSVWCLATTVAAASLLNPCTVHACARVRTVVRMCAFASRKSIDVSHASAAAQRHVQPSDEAEIELVELLSTCIDACEHGCSEIRRIHDKLERDHLGTVTHVDYKACDDFRSALTSADLASQQAICTALKHEWPSLRIVGEENLEGYASDKFADQPCSLRHDLCSHLAPLHVPLSEICIFVDPLDGTREFVEGRVQNVQVLIGIAFQGRSVGGVIGQPFARDRGADESKSVTRNENHVADTTKTHAIQVVYALDGAAGHSEHEEKDNTLTPTVGGIWSTYPRPNVSIYGARPLLVTGDAQDAALTAAYEAALSCGGQHVQLGGTGRKCLAIAEGCADIAIMNFQSSAWDTCAPEAVVRAGGGDVTDLFGDRIIYLAEPSDPATYMNECGVIVSAAGLGGQHRAVCAAMRNNPKALERLKRWGLGDTRSGKPSAEAVGKALRKRREHMRSGLSTR